MGLAQGKMEPMTGSSQDGMYGSRRSRLQKMEHKLSAHMDSEDKRVRELTEGILYDFLPAALNVMLPRCEDPLQELDADRCRAVASAALAVSALMNAPPGFLEFLLCVPWRKLSQLYPKTPNLAARSDSIDKLVSNLQVTDDERRKLVNTRIDPALMGTVLDFLYKDKHADSVPPMLQLTPVNPLQPDDKSAPLVVRETVAAVLDGATPLHCAALRGNPAQVDHLLYCGADPTLKTAAGELPIEQVPVCGDRAAPAPAAAGLGSGATTAQRNCRCMGSHDQEVWECRSRLARSLIARRCFFSIGVGLFTWLRLVVFCLLGLLGQAGCYTSIVRPVVERHIDTRRQQKVAAARARAHALVTRMRSEADAGLRHLELAKLECMGSEAFQRGPPDISQMCFTDKLPRPPPPPVSQIHDINFHLQESGTSSTGEELASEKAFKCFVRSVHALQSLDLHGDTVPQVFAELVQARAAESRETHVLEDEQAELYSCWAESVLLKFRGCTCPGCAALAIQAVRMAHIQATRLFGKVDRVKQSHAERLRAVGQALARVVYVHICLLLETEAQASPTRSLVWRAEQCLREWDRLEKSGLTQGAGVLDPRHVVALQLWAKTADADLYLAEALHGQSMPPTKTLQEVVQGAVCYSADSSSPMLARPVSGEVVVALEQAITLASLPSPMLARIVRGVVANAVAELTAAARLREFVGARGAAALGGAGGGTSEAVASLTDVLREAEPFRSRLGPELDAAQELHARWKQRAQALEKLEGAVEEVRSYTAVRPLSFSLAGAAAAAVGVVGATVAPGSPAGSLAEVGAPRPGPGLPRAEGASGPGGSRSEANGGAAAAPVSATGGGGDFSSVDASSSSSSGGAEGAQPPDLAEWDRRMKQLEAAMNDAKDANISVTKAKRLLKEMAAVAAAAEAARQLEAMMARRPSGPLQLKLALNKAEGAASTLSGLGGAPVPGLADVLGPLMAAARRRLDTERAAEALSKAAASFRTLADLARLEAAIYNAKKIGAEELDPESYRTSLELRAHLQEAARGRTALETALRNLQNQLRPEDAEVLERALQDAARWGDLLAADVAKARKALEQWRAMTVSDAKLARLLREGTSTGVLARAIQEAAASGVKVQQAKRVLKLMQALETVLAGGGVDGGAAERHSAVKAKLDAAEQGGAAAGPLPEAARRMLARLAAQVARESLEAALKQHSDWSVAQRISALREALDKAEGMLVVVAKEQHQQLPGFGGDTAGENGTPQQKQQKQAPKLANGSVVGKTSRGKRSSGSSSIASSAGDVQVLAHHAQAGHQLDDAAASGSEPPTPSTLASSSGGSSGSSSAANSSSGGSSGTCGGGAAATAGAAGGGDDEVVAAVRDLARKARQVLEEDQAEMARIERERLEAERARKEAQERERQERQRQEQERQKREKAEAAERERLLAEKRERAKAEKTRQQHHHNNHHHHHQQQQHQAQQHKGKAAAAAPVLGESSGAAGASGTAAEKGGGGGAKASAASKTGGKGGSHSGTSSAAANGRSGIGPVTVSAVAAAVGKAAMPRDPQVPPPPAPGAGNHQLAHSQLSAAPETPVAAAAAAAGLSPAAPAVLRPARAAAVVPPELFAPQLLSSADAVVVVGGGGGGALTQPSATMTVVHTRGDSLESLGEVAHTLNKKVIEALEMDRDVSPPHAYSPLSAGAVVSSAPGGVGTSGAGSGGGSVARTASSTTTTAPLADSILERTSSVISSIASADDVMLQSTAVGSGLVAGLSGGVIGGASSLSTISAGCLQQGASNANSDVTPLQPSSAAAAAAAAPDGGYAAGGVAVLGAGGSLSNGGGGGMACKPRFGFVDLGGASWGLDSPLLTGSAMAPSSLFSSLQPPIGDFATMLGAPKPDAGGGGCGWPAGPLSAGAAASPGVLIFGGQGRASGAADEVGALLGTSATGRHHTLGGGGGGGGGGLHVHAPDPSTSGLVVVHASPRTTVATASAGVHGIVQVRPRGAGGMPSTGPALVQLASPGGTPAAAAGGGGSGRPSLHLQPGQQPSSGGGGGLVARSSFWTPPSFQTSVDLSMDGASSGAAGGGVSLAAAVAVSSLHSGGGVGRHHLGLGPAAAAGLQGLDWGQHQQPTADSGLQLVHLGTGASVGGLAAPGAGAGGGAGGGMQLLRPGGAVTAAASRICRFFLQGYCRDGERCRFAHHAASGAAPPGQGGGGGGGPQLLMQLGPGSLPQPLSQPQQQQHHFLGHMGGFAAASNAVGGGRTAGSSVGQSSAVGSFAFGAPGAEAFAPLGGGCGSGMVSRTSTGMGSMASGGELLTAEQLRHGTMVGATGGGGGGSLAGCPSPGLVLLERNQLGSQSLPVGGLAAAGGGNGAVLGAHLQSVQLRDSATGATFSAVLTIPGTSTVGGSGGGSDSFQAKQHQSAAAAQQQQQALLLALPDDLSYSPPSSAGPSGTGR